MTKQEFLDGLSRKLQGIPQNDREKSLEYYAEMIDDRIEDGLTEQQAVNAMGNVDDIVQKIIDETPIEKILTEKVTPKRKLSGAEIALTAILFPIWFPILISAISVIFVLYFVLWVLILCIYIVVLSFALSGIASIAAFVAGLLSGQALWGMFVLGCGMVLLGLAIPLTMAAGKATFGCIHLTGNIFKKIKSALAKRKGDV